MRLFIDTNNFVVQAVAKETCVCGHSITGVCIHSEGYCGCIPEYTTVLDSTFARSTEVLDNYGLPKYKYDSVSQSVVDSVPEDFMLDETFKPLFIKKLKDEVLDELNTKTDSELKTIYDNSPTYKQDMMYTLIELINADQIPQNTINLMLETFIKVMAEYFYITLVLNQQPTESQLNAVKLLLTKLHNHNSLYPLDVNAWYIPYTEAGLTNLDTLRSQTLPRRLYITGRS